MMMLDTRLDLDANNKGAFIALEGEKQVGEMVVSIAGAVMTVYHTEVIPEMQGRGVARQLLGAMLGYVYEHKLKVLPLCPYVHSVFTKDPVKYEPIWFRPVAPKNN
jgi:predicted GNAT family acetyltransferase